MVKTHPSRRGQSTDNVVSRHKYNKMKKKLKDALEVNKTLIQVIVCGQVNRASLTDFNSTTQNVEENNDYNSLLKEKAAENRVLISTTPPVIRASNNDKVPPQSSIPTVNQESIHHQETQSKQQAPPSSANLASDIQLPLKLSRRNFHTSSLRINSAIRPVQPVERNDDASPKLPQQVGIWTVLNLGEIKFTSLAFHTKNFIFPIGYCVQKIFNSMVSPNNKTIYTLSILDNGNTPLFQIASADRPGKIISADSIDEAWAAVSMETYEIRGRASPLVPHGAHHYGLENATMALLLQQLPGANKLRNYMWQEFEEVNRSTALSTRKRQDTLINRQMKEVLNVSVEEYDNNNDLNREESMGEDNSSIVRLPSSSNSINNQVQEKQYNISSSQEASSSSNDVVMIYDSSDEEEETTAIKQEERQTIY